MGIVWVTGTICNRVIFEEGVSIPEGMKVVVMPMSEVKEPDFADPFFTC